MHPATIPKKGLNAGWPRATIKKERMPKSQRFDVERGFINANNMKFPEYDRPTIKHVFLHE